LVLGEQSSTVYGYVKICCTLAIYFSSKKSLLVMVVIMGLLAATTQ